VYCRPSPPCIITPVTKVTFVRDCRYRFRELEHNVLVEVYYPDSGSRSFYIYPKRVWSTVYDKYLEPMSRGRPPYEPGLLLYGPKGTGKTSMINILADVLGLYRVKVDTSVLSKYVGESEERFRAKLAEAESNEPSIVDMDEQDYLVTRRDLYGVGYDSSLGHVRDTMLSILLVKMPQYKREGRLILIVMATNRSPSTIDEALLRHERFGEPVFVPLPDYEAVRTYLELSGVRKIIGDREVERLAVILTSIGITMADLQKIVDEIKDKGRIPDLTQLTKYERGYKRPYPARLVELGGSLLIEKIRPYTRGRARLLVSASRTQICEAICVMILAALKIPAVVFTDPRKFDEAIETAENCGGVLLVPVDYTPDDIIRYIHVNAKCPVWYMSTGRLPPVEYGDKINLEDPYLYPGRKRTIIEVVCSYFGIDYSEEDIRRLIHDDAAYSNFVRKIGLAEVKSVREIIGR